MQRAEQSEVSVRRSRFEAVALLDAGSDARTGEKVNPIVPADSDLNAPHHAPAGATPVPTSVRELAVPAVARVLATAAGAHLARPRRSLEKKRGAEPHPLNPRAQRAVSCVRRWV